MLPAPCYIKSRHKTNNLPALISCTPTYQSNRPLPQDDDFGGTGAHGEVSFHKAIIFARCHDSEADASRQMPCAISAKNLLLAKREKLMEKT